METWICGSLFVSPVQPYSRANAIVLAQMSICPTIWTERHVHEQSACDSRLWSAEREIANGATERATPPPWTCLNGTARWLPSLIPARWALKQENHNEYWNF